MAVIKDFLVLAITAMLVENFVLVKFMGICPFLGVSKKIETAFGMGIAVTFVMVMASALTWVVNKYIIMGAEYLQTIAFILVILFFSKKLFALENGLLLKNPLFAEKGDG